MDGQQPAATAGGKSRAGYQGPPPPRNYAFKRASGGASRPDTSGGSGHLQRPDDKRRLGAPSSLSGNNSSSYSRRPATGYAAMTGDSRAPPSSSSSSRPTPSLWDHKTPSSSSRPGADSYYSSSSSYDRRRISRSPPPPHSTSTPSLSSRYDNGGARGGGYSRPSSVLHESSTPVLATPTARQPYTRDNNNRFSYEAPPPSTSSSSAYNIMGHTQTPSYSARQRGGHSPTKDRPSMMYNSRASMQASSSSYMMGPPSSSYSSYNRRDNYYGSAATPSLDQKRESYSSRMPVAASSTPLSDEQRYRHSQSAYTPSTSYDKTRLPPPSMGSSSQVNVSPQKPLVLVPTAKDKTSDNKTSDNKTITMTVATKNSDVAAAAATEDQDSSAVSTASALTAAKEGEEGQDDTSSEDEDDSDEEDNANEADEEDVEEEEEAFDQDEIEEQIDRLDNEIARYETQLASLRSKAKAAAAQAALDRKESPTEDVPMQHSRSQSELLAKEQVVVKPWENVQPVLSIDEVVDKIYAENRLKAQSQTQSTATTLRSLLPPSMDKFTTRLEEYDFLQDDLRRHETLVAGVLRSKLASRKRKQCVKATKLALEYQEAQAVWQRRVERMEAGLEKKKKVNSSSAGLGVVVPLPPNTNATAAAYAMTNSHVVGPRTSSASPGLGHASTPGLSNQQLPPSFAGPNNDQQGPMTGGGARSSRRSGFRSDYVKSESELASALLALGVDPTELNLEGPKYAPRDDPARLATEPQMILDPVERSLITSYHCTLGLVKDPVADLAQENANLDLKWSEEERAIFKLHLLKLGKSFNKIAAYLPLKSTADCIQYYYREKISLGFKQALRRGANASQRGGNGGRRGKKQKVDTTELSMLFRVWDLAPDEELPRQRQGLVEKTSRVPDHGHQESQDWDVSNQSEAPQQQRPKTSASNRPKQSSKPSTAAAPDDNGPLPAHITPWTDDDKVVAFEAFEYYGKDFAGIAVLLGTKTEEQVRSLYNNHHRRRPARATADKKSTEDEMMIKQPRATKPSGKGDDMEADHPPRTTTPGHLTGNDDDAMDSDVTKKRKKRGGGGSKHGSAKKESSGPAATVSSPVSGAFEDDNGDRAKKRSRRRAGEPDEGTPEAQFGSGDENGFRKTISYWSVAERAQFVKSLAQHGRNWSAISKQIKTKSAIQIRNYFSNYRAKLKFDLILEANGKLGTEEQLYDESELNARSSPNAKTSKEAARPAPEPDDAWSGYPGSYPDVSMPLQYPSGYAQDGPSQPGPPGSWPVYPFAPPDYPVSQYMMASYMEQMYRAQQEGDGSGPMPIMPPGSYVNYTPNPNDILPPIRFHQRPPESSEPLTHGPTSSTTTQPTTEEKVMEDAAEQASSWPQSPNKTVTRPLVMNLISHSSESLSTDGAFPAEVTDLVRVATTTDRAPDVVAPQDAMESAALPEASEAPVPQESLDSPGQLNECDLKAEAHPSEVPAQEAPAQVGAPDTQEEPRPSATTEDSVDACSANEENQASVTDDSLVAESRSENTISGDDAQEIEQMQEPGEEPE